MAKLSASLRDRLGVQEALAGTGPAASELVTPIPAGRGTDRSKALDGIESCSGLDVSAETSRQGRQGSSRIGWHSSPRIQPLILAASSSTLPSSSSFPTWFSCR